MDYSIVSLPTEKNRWRRKFPANCQWDTWLCLLLLIPLPAAAADWPHYRGPERNGTSSETGWLERWPPSAAPQVAWRAQVGKGHTAVSIAGDRAVTLGWDGERDTVFCFEAATGKLVWKESYHCAKILQWPGPRATPAIHQGHVYTMGQHGQLRAWELATGKLVWHRDLPEKYNPDVDYGFCWSPLIVPAVAGQEGEDLLILNAGSRGLAIRCRDGSIAWGDDGQKGACVSAVPYRTKDGLAIVIVNINEQRSAANIIGVEPRTGRELWRWNGWQEQWGAMGVDPVVHEGRLFVTSAQEYRQAARFTIDGTSLTQDWTTNRLAGYTGSAVLLKEHLYLVDSRGLLRCVDWGTGTEVWNQRGFDERGTLIAADGKLLIQTGSSGKLIVVAADPKQYRELRQMTVFNHRPETFTAPAISNGRIYCRSYAGEVVCVDVRGR